MLAAKLRLCAGLFVSLTLFWLAGCGGNSSPGSEAERAIGGPSRTGLFSMSPKESPSAVMSSRERANPGAPRFAGRRRNMPSKSTIPLRLRLSR